MRIPLEDGFRRRSPAPDDVTRPVLRWLLVALLGLTFMVAGAGCRQRPSGAPVPREEAGYVASIMRESYHRLTCQWAKRINPENAVYYRGKADAEGDGHRPCRVCRP